MCTYIGRNIGEGHALLNLGLRLSRTFIVAEKMCLQVLGEMFNALNHVNVATLNGYSEPEPTRPIRRRRLDRSRQ